MKPFVRTRTNYTSTTVDLLFVTEECEQPLVIDTNLLIRLLPSSLKQPLRDWQACCFGDGASDSSFTQRKAPDDISAIEQLKRRIETLEDARTIHEQRLQSLHQRLAKLELTDEETVDAEAEIAIELHRIETLHADAFRYIETTHNAICATLSRVELAAAETLSIVADGGDEK